MKLTCGRRAVILVAILLALAVGLAYLPVVRNGFVPYDDDLYLYENPMVQKGLSPSGLAWALTTFHAANWHPLTWISHMADVQLFGLDPRGHHLMGVYLHALNTVLVFLVVLAYTGAFWPGALVAALFGLHPLHVESVAWASERKDLLCAFFWLLAMLAYLRHLRRPSGGRYLALLFCMALGLMSKPMIVTLPFALLLMDWWPLGRLPRTAGNGPRAESPIGGVLLEKMPLLAMSIAGSLLTYAAQSAGHSLKNDRIPLVVRAANALVSYVGYLLQTVWPAGLSVPYPYRMQLPFWQPLAALLFLAAVTWVTVVTARRRPYLGVGWLWFLGVLVPVIGLVQVGLQSSADRYTYLPHLGIFLGGVWLLAGAAEKVPMRIKVVVSLSVLIILGSLTWRQVAYWRNGITLFTRSLAVNPENGYAHSSLGKAFFDQGDNAAAETHLRRAMVLTPWLASPHVNLGVILGGRGRHDLAAEEFRMALERDPWNEKIGFNLAQALALSGRKEEAVEHYRRLIARNPREPRYLLRLGRVLADLGRWPEAQGLFRQTVETAPGSAEGWFNLGLASAGLGDQSGAVQAYQRALDLNPTYADALFNLALAAAALGRRQEAMDAGARLERLDPVLAGRLHALVR